MKKTLFSLVIMISFISNIAFADCDFKTGITPVGNGTQIYSQDCHRQVGLMVQQLQTKDMQIQDLSKAIDLKNIALKASDDRTQLWMDTSFKLEQRVESIDTLRKQNDWLYFGLGALTVIGTGFMAASLIRH